MDEVSYLKVARRILVYILLPVFAVTLPLFFVNGSAPSFDYYFKVNDTHTRPDVCPEADFLGEYEDVITMGGDEKVDRKSVV